MATSQENIEFLELFNEVLPNFDLPTAYQVRNFTLKRIHELEQNIIEERIKFRSEVAAKAEELGMTTADIFPTKPRVKAPPKYQDPDDPTKTWSGKGKTPNWVKAVLESGKTLDDLLIPTTVVDQETGF